MSFRVLKFKPGEQPQAAAADAAAPAKPTRIKQPPRPRQRLVVGGLRRGQAPDPEVQRAAAPCGTRRGPCAASASRRAGTSIESSGKGSVTATPCCTTRPSPATTSRSGRPDRSRGGHAHRRQHRRCAPEDIHIGMKVECMLRGHRRRHEAPLLLPREIGERSDPMDFRFSEEQTPSASSPARSSRRR